MSESAFQPLRFPSLLEREETGEEWAWLPAWGEGEPEGDSGEEGQAEEAAAQGAAFESGLAFPADEDRVRQGGGAESGAEDTQEGQEQAEDAEEHGPSAVDPEELERLREEARQEGYNAGLLEGREQGEQEGREAMERVQATFLDSFEQALTTLTEGQADIRIQWREPLMQVVRTVCERILRRTLDNELSDYLERLVVAALEELEAGSETRVTLGDVTPGVVEELRERLHTDVPAHNLRLHRETGHSADFVRVDTQYGIIQTDLESQLDRVLEEVEQGLTSGEEPTPDAEAGQEENAEGPSEEAGPNEAAAEAGPEEQQEQEASP